MNNETTKTIEAIKKFPAHRQLLLAGFTARGANGTPITTDELIAVATSHESLQSEVDHLRKALDICLQYGFFAQLGMSSPDFDYEKITQEKIEIILRRQAREALSK